MMARDRTLLVEYGGHIKLKNSWAISLMQRMNFVKHRGSTKAKTSLPENVFSQVRHKFLSQIAKMAHDTKIPPQLVINWDQTGFNIVPSSSWTMEEQGSNTIPIAGLGDKRQITATVSVTMSGEMLPLQVLYAGTTERCHPAYAFPPTFDIWHTPNHWANTQTTIRLINNVVLPYVATVRERIELPTDYPAIVIFDAFKGHKGPEIDTLLRENHLLPVPVPNNCTDRLQPIDLSVNKPIKDHLRNKFTAWYAAQVKNQLDSGRELAKVNIDLRLSVMKEVEAAWIVSSFDYIKSNRSIIENGFIKAGILDAIEGRLSVEEENEDDPFADLD